METIAFILRKYFQKRRIKRELRYLISYHFYMMHIPIASSYCRILKCVEQL